MNLNKKINLKWLLFFIGIFNIDIGSAEQANFEPESSIVEYIKKFEVKKAWIWVDLYSDDRPESAPYSPGKIILVPDTHIKSVESILDGASVKINSKNFNGKFLLYAIIFSNANDEYFGLLRNPSQSGGLFQFINVNMENEPFVTRQVSVANIARKDGSYDLQLSGIYLPKFAESEVQKFVNSVVRSYEDSNGQQEK